MQGDLELYMFIRQQILKLYVMEQDHKNDDESKLYFQKNQSNPRILITMQQILCLEKVVNTTDQYQYPLFQGLLPYFIKQLMSY